MGFITQDADFKLSVDSEGYVTCLFRDPEPYDFENIRPSFRENRLYLTEVPEGAGYGLTEGNVLRFPSADKRYIDYIGEYAIQIDSDGKMFIDKSKKIELWLTPSKNIQSDTEKGDEIPVEDNANTRDPEETKAIVRDYLLEQIAEKAKNKQFEAVKAIVTVMEEVL